jgi:hypothetical protein
MYTKMSSILKPLFCGEALQFEATGPQLCTFHMDLHPPTHVQLKLPMVDVWEIWAKPTQTLVPYWMPKPLPPRNQCTGWFATAMFRICCV